MLDIKPMINERSVKVVDSEENQGLNFQVMLLEDEMIVAMDLEQRLEMLDYQVAAQATIRGFEIHHPLKIHQISKPALKIGCYSLVQLYQLPEAGSSFLVQEFITTF